MPRDIIHKKMQRDLSMVQKTSTFFDNNELYPGCLAFCVQFFEAYLCIIYNFKVRLDTESHGKRIVIFWKINNIFAFFQRFACIVTD